MKALASQAKQSAPVPLATTNANMLPWLEEALGYSKLVPRRSVAGPLLRDTLKTFAPQLAGTTEALTLRRARSAWQGLEAYSQELGVNPRDLEPLHLASFLQPPRKASHERRAWQGLRWLHKNLQMNWDLVCVSRLRRIEAL